MCNLINRPSKPPSRLDSDSALVAVDAAMLADAAPEPADSVPPPAAEGQKQTVRPGKKRVR